MKQLVFVDGDGTLKDDNGNISEKTIEILTKLQNHDIEVIITTGRPRYHALKVKNNSNASDYIISSNGAEIYNVKNNEVVYANYLDSESVLKIYEIIMSHNGRLAMTVEDKEVVTDVAKNVNQISLDQDIELFLNNNKVKQLYIRSDNEKEANFMYQKIRKMDKIKIVNESIYFKTGVVEKKGIWFTVTNENVNKGKAIEVLCKYLNVDLNNTYGFGNDYNDIEMFETVKHSIIMSNANDELKGKAKIIAKSNDENGVACYLEELFLKEED